MPDTPPSPARKKYIDHERTEIAVCPFCGYEYEEESEDMIHGGTYDCDLCKRRFFFEIETLYSTHGLCDGPYSKGHDWKPTVTPSYEKCARCFDVRKTSVTAS